MFERFTQRALRSIVLAQEEARSEGYIVVDVGHLGLGALAAGLDDGLVARLRHALRSTLADLPIDEGRDHVSSRDLLVAALTNPRVAAALAPAGTDPDEIRAALDACVPDSGDLRPGRA